MDDEEGENQKEENDLEEKDHNYNVKADDSVNLKKKDAEI